jgi:guanylate kinase
VIQRRMAAARDEMAHAGAFQYRIINKDFETAKAELAQIVRAHRRPS